MNLISKEEFVALDDAAYETLDVPGWGTVRIRSLTGAGRDRYLKRALEPGPSGALVAKQGDAEALLLALTLCDEQGNLWFESVEEGVQLLREKSASALQTAFQAALKVNGLAEEALEEAAGNLDAAPSVELGSS